MELKEIKILGLYFGDKAATEKNFLLPEIKFKKTLNLWKQRNLSIKGRKIVVNQLATSKLNYPAHIFVRPPNLVKSITQAIINFVANGKKTKVASHMLYLPVELGGMSLIDIDRRFRALRLNWISRYYKSPQSEKWIILATYFLDKFRSSNLGINVFKTFIEAKRDKLSKVRPFYKTLLQDWTSFTNNERPLPDDLNLIYNEPIYHNFFIPDRPELAPIKIPDWYKTDNFKLIGDLCHQYLKGFHKTTEIQDLTECEDIQPMMNKIINNMPANWAVKIRTVEPPKHQKNDLYVTLVNSEGKKSRAMISKLTSKTLAQLTWPNIIFHFVYTNLPPKNAFCSICGKVFFGM